MEDGQGLPDDIDPELWFECRHHSGERDFIVREPWQTFPGRIAAWCSKRRVSFRVSKAELPEALPVATRYWVDGFLVGNVPRQPDADDFDDPAVAAWRAKAERFLADGAWPPMSDVKRQWFEDAQILAEVGRALEDQRVSLPVVEARIPTELAQRAVAAWSRDDQPAEPDETATERVHRRRAGALALIGLAIEERGVTTIDGVVVDLPATSWSTPLSRARRHECLSEVRAPVPWQERMAHDGRDG